MLPPVGNDGRRKLFISSSSSMEGKVVANSDKAIWFRCGDEEADEEGEGGPKLDVGTRV